MKVELQQPILLHNLTNQGENGKHGGGAYHGGTHPIPGTITHDQLLVSG